MISRLKPGVFLLPLLILFWPAVRQPDAILFPTFSPYTDLLVIHWPKARLMAQTWQAGDGLPLWSPLILSGMPLAPNQLAMLFYPPAWLFLVLPPEPVFNLFFTAHLWLGGAGVYLLLARGHRLSSPAALVGGLAFLLNGKWLAHLAGGHLSLVAAVAWMPWAVLGLLMALRTEPPAARLRWLLLASLAASMQALTHTLPLIYTAYLLLAMTLWHSLTPPLPRPLHRLAVDLLVPALTLLLAAGLAAVQLLPLAELATYSNRALSPEQAAAFALTSLQLLVGLLLPAAQAGHEGIIYAGLVPLALAPLALTRRRDWPWFYAALFLLAALYALGPATPLHRLAYTLLPGFRWVRTPARIFLAGGLALSVLSGFAVERLTRDRWSNTAARRLARAALFAGLLALLTGGGLALIAPAVRSPALALAVFIPAALAVTLARVRQKISARYTVLALALLTAADLGRFDASLMRFVPPDTAMSPGQAEAQYLARQTGLFRVYSPSYSLPVQTAALAGLSLADGVEPVHLAVYDQFMARAGGYGDASFSVTIPNFGDQPPETALRSIRPDPRLLGLLNVQYLVSAFPLDAPGLSLVHRTDTAYIYRNRAARPRAWVAYRSEPAGENWLDRLSGPPAEGQTVLVEQGPLLDPPAAGLPSTAQVVDYRANRLAIDVQTAAPGWLVVSEIWYPGWQATVNHAQLPVERVNGLLRGVYLPQAGRYRVEMVYRPWSVRLGGWISGLTTAVYFILAAASIRSWMRGSISAGLG